MKAIVPAAGRGQRMGALGREIHKALQRIDGETILSRLVAQLTVSEIDEVIIVTGFRAEDLRSHVESLSPSVAIRWVHNPKFDTGNNIVSLDLGLQAIEPGNNILIVEADLVLAPGVIRTVLASPHSNVAAVSAYRPGLDGTVVRMENKLITSVHLSEDQGGDFNFSQTYKTVNLYKFSAQYCDTQLRPRIGRRIKSEDTRSYYEAAIAETVSARLPDCTLYGENIAPADWAEIDNRTDLDAARYAFEPQSRISVLDRAFGGKWNYPVVDFSLPANVRFPNSAAMAEIQARLPSLITQYGSAQDILDRKMADFVSRNPTHVVALNGLSQIYPILRRQLADETVLIPKPTFGEYGRTLPGCGTYRDPGKIDWETIESGAEQHTCIIFVNPNNPTGTWISSDAIIDFATRHSSQRVIVDESFADFATEASLIDLESDLLPRNLIILKSLGKTLGVPGLRLGMAYSRDIDFLERVRAEIPIWSSNSVAEAFLEVAMRHRSAIARSLVETRSDREAMLMSLRRCAAVRQVWPSEANFLLVQLVYERHCLARFLDRLLVEHGIYVKDLSNKFETGSWVRLSVRLPAENGKLLAAMEVVARDQAHT